MTMKETDTMKDEMDAVQWESQLETLRWQFQLTWRLTKEYSLAGLSDSACLWEPGPGSWNVRQSEEGRWIPDWNVPEPDPAPPVTIGWVTWHLIWWWTNLLAAVKGQATADHSEVDWPGSAALAVQRIETLAAEWSGFLSSLSEADLEKPLAHPWPTERPLRYAVAWANIELMKNAAEIGITRHIYEAHHK